MEFYNLRFTYEIVKMSLTGNGLWKFYLGFILLFISLSEVKCTEEKVQEQKRQATSDAVEEPLEKIAEDSGVLILTEKNFDIAIKDNIVILVEFYAPWCGHCKQLAPDYSKAALKLKENDPPVTLAKVDCTVEKKLGNRFNVQGYPTLKIFKNGVSTDYDGPRETNGIVDYMKARADPNWKHPPEAVVTLTKENFTKITEAEEMMLVEFYAPWCGHCKQLAPELEKAAKELKENIDQIVIAKVDATVETELAQEYEVKGYPTMKIFRFGKPYEYKGPRQAKEIVAYLENQVGPPSLLMKTLAEAKKFTNLDEPVLMGVFDNEEDPIYKLYIEANDDIRDEYMYAHVFGSDAKKHYGLKKSAILMIHPEYLLSKYEKRFQIFDDETGSPSEVKEFYKDNHVPLVGHMQQHTEVRFSKRPLVVVFYEVNFNKEYRSMTQFWRNKILKTANKYRDIQFAVADENNFEPKLKELGLDESGEAINAGLYSENGYRYAMVDEGFSEESFEEFLEEFKAGKLKPIIKSQKVVPRNSKPGKVQIVTGKSFNDIVMDESKEVFIEFYAPWCGHCKAIEGHIVDLAKYYKKEKDIIIAKMDGTVNEAPKQYSYTGFPTIYYSKPGKKSEPIIMVGQRDLDGLKKFVEDNSDILKKKTSKEEL